MRPVPPEQPQLDLERFGARHLRVVTPAFFAEPIGTPHYALQLVRWVRSQGWTGDVVAANPYYRGSNSTMLRRLS